MKKLIIIPCYNEQASIENVVRNLKSAAPDIDFLIVNDCSKDASLSILKANNFNFLDLPVNLGIGGGVQSGYLYAREHGYDITVQMDGDGQHDPTYLNNIIAPVANGEADMCIGSRFINKDGFQTSFMRRVGIKIVSLVILLLTGKYIKDTTSGFRACNKKLTAFYAENYAQDYPEPEAIISALKNGFKVSEVPVAMRERDGGTSSISAIHAGYYMVKVVLSLIVHGLSVSGRKRG